MKVLLNMFAIEKPLLLLLPVLAVLLAKCGSSGSSGNNAGERTTMSGWKTMPVGRMLIDVPNEAVISFREDKIWATVLAWEPELTPGQAVAEARQKETAYRQVKATQEGQSPTMFRNMVPLANGGLGVHHWTKIYDTYSAYTTDIDCYFITPPPNGRVFRYIYGGIGAEPANLLDAENRMKSLSETFHAREEEEMPTAPGYCFYGGFSAFNGRRHEHINRHFTLPRYQGLKIIFLFETVGREKDFEDPGAGLVRLFSLFSGQKVLRNRKVKLEGRPRAGRELCVTFTNPNTGGREYDFILVVPGEHPMDQPGIYLSMQSGSVSAPATYAGPQTFSSNEEALKWWDTLVKGIRSRPGAI